MANEQPSTGQRIQPEEMLQAAREILSKLLALSDVNMAGDDIGHINKQIEVEVAAIRAAELELKRLKRLRR
jgi:hypothetical protein